DPYGPFKFLVPRLIEEYCRLGRHYVYEVLWGIVYQNVERVVCLGHCVVNEQQLIRVDIVHIKPHSNIGHSWPLPLGYDRYPVSFVMDTLCHVSYSRLSRRNFAPPVLPDVAKVPVNLVGRYRKHRWNVPAYDVLFSDLGVVPSVVLVCPDEHNVG